MVKKDASAAALAPAETPSSTLASVPVTEADKLAALLAGAGIDEKDDGLQETDSEDLRLPILVWNMKGKDPKTGELRRLNEFYDTLNEVSHKTVECAFIHLHKTRLFSRFDNDANENAIYCSSNDRVTGRMRDKHPDGLMYTDPKTGNRLPVVQGVVRDCEGCPDANWHQNAAGKNVRNCDQVYGVFAAFLDADKRPTDGFLIRFKRTGLQPFKTHMQKHHLGKRPLPNGQKANVPLFMFGVTLTLDVAQNGNYATPVITRGDLLPQETIVLLAQQSKFFADIGDEATKVAERHERQHEAADGGGGGGGKGAAGGAMKDDDFV